MRFGLLALSILLVTPVVSSAQPSACPDGMAWLDGFCIDRWEAHLVDHSPYEVPTDGVAATAAGVVPQGYISGDVAEQACENANKRLCSITEWRRACRGRLDHAYPYGNAYVAGACNDTRAVHPVIEVFGSGATFTGAQLNDPQLNQLADSLDATGANAQCVTPEGVHDLHGNLNEWVHDPSGTFLGGFYVDASINGEGCSYTTTAHSVLNHDFSTGFRCCADAEGTRHYVPVSGPASWSLLAVLLTLTGGAGAFAVAGLRSSGEKRSRG